MKTVQSDLPTTAQNVDPANAGNTDSESEFRNGLLALIPFLRAFSRSLCGDRELADDLAQEALSKAWRARASFQSGTNLKAWLFAILRNEFYSNRRQAWRHVPWDDGTTDQSLTVSEAQTSAVELSDVARLLHSLPVEQREALILVGAGGFSYEAAAKIANCAVGTVKSRVARARKALIAALDGDRPSGDAQPHAEGAIDEIMGQIEQYAVPQPAPDDQGRSRKRRTD